MSEYRYAFIVPQGDTKIIKTHLENQGMLDKSEKIKSVLSNGIWESRLVTMVLASNCVREHTMLSEIEKEHVLQKHGFMNSQLSATTLQICVVEIPKVELTTAVNLKPLQLAIWRCLNMTDLPASRQYSTPDEDVLRTLPTSYNVYPPMMLLPAQFLQDESQSNLLSFLATDNPLSDSFYMNLARVMDVTHIAINAPIPTNNHDIDDNAVAENIVRSPHHFRPVFGNFGPQLPAFPDYTPTTKDFDEAFWVSAYQNGINQIWAPRYTMFSAGNVTEKARVLNLHSVAGAVDTGRFSGTGCAAVDLFAGIGYFTFSYAKAGVTQILCWDLNPWSVEGLRRGAAANKWSCEIIAKDKLDTTWDDTLHKDKIIVFCESNIHAKDRVAHMRKSTPPIRHVNCGMLPTVGEAWKTAVEVIDPYLGGWIHLHETFAQKDISGRVQDYVNMVQDQFDCLREKGAEERKVILEDIVRVKSVGPKLWHFVLDIFIPPW